MRILGNMLVFTLLALSAGCAGTRTRSPANEKSWHFAVISDVHVDNHGRMTPEYHRLLEQLALRQPAFVVVAGDSTNGNPKDAWRIEDVRAWWRVFKESLTVLRDAHIPVLPIAGNHDSYREVHRQGYAEAWADLEESASPLKINPSVVDRDRSFPGAEMHAPFSYSVDVDGLHLSLAHLVDETDNPRVYDWLRSDLAEAPAGSTKLVFGHVPLISVMSRTTPDFRDKFGSLMIQQGVAAYVAGHEHLIWDEVFPIEKAGKLRQVIVGTASASYTWMINSESREHAHCARRPENTKTCRMPMGGYPFTLKLMPSTPGDRDYAWREAKRVAFIEVEVHGNQLTFTPYSLGENGQIVPFADE